MSVHEAVARRGVVDVSGIQQDDPVVVFVIVTEPLGVEEPLAAMTSAVATKVEPVVIGELPVSDPTIGVIDPVPQTAEVVAAKVALPLNRAETLKVIVGSSTMQVPDDVPVTPVVATKVAVQVRPELSVTVTEPQGAAAPAVPANGLATTTETSWPCAVVLSGATAETVTVGVAFVTVTLVAGTLE